MEARIESIALTSTLIPPEEGDEPGEVSVQPAARMRITRSTNKRSGVQSFMAGLLLMIHDMCFGCGVKREHEKETGKPVECQSFCPHLAAYVMSAFGSTKKLRMDQIIFLSGCS